MPARLSPTPPLTQPISKRDKRRTNIEQKFKDLVSNFSQNREAQLRAQLNALSRDMYFINQANPYQNKPLADFAGDLFIDIGALDNSVAGGQRGEPSSTNSDTRVPVGKFAAQYVEQINDAMEERDADLTEVDVSA
jgi:hypothetical protein